MHDLKMLVRSLAKMQQLQAELGPLNARRLTQLELFLSETFARGLEQGTHDNRAVATPNSISHNCDESVEAIQRFARTVSRAKRSTVYVSIDEFTDGGAPHTALASDLTSGEKLLLEILRRQVCTRRERNPDVETAPTGPPTMDRSKADACLARIIQDTAIAAFRTVDIRCGACSTISPDEARILHAVAIGQRGFEASVREVLSSWMLDAATRLTSLAVLGLAQALIADGERLPLREWNFDHLEKMQGIKSMPIERANDRNRRILH